MLIRFPTTHANLAHLKEQPEVAFVDPSRRPVDPTNLQLPNSVCDSESLKQVDVEQVDFALFEEYLREFPCFWRIGTAMDPVEIFQSYLDDSLSDGQDLAVEAVLEIISGQCFPFTLSAAYRIWGKADMDAFVRVISRHATLHFS